MHSSISPNIKVLHIRFWLSRLVQDSSDSTHSLLQNVPLEQNTKDEGKGTQSIFNCVYSRFSSFVWMEAATKTAIERKTERRPKTRPRSSSWPDLTNIKVVAVTRLSGTWIILRSAWGAPGSYWDKTILSKIWTWTVDVVMLWQNQENAAEHIGGCIDDHHHADNDETHSK